MNPPIFACPLPTVCEILDLVGAFADRVRSEGVEVSREYLKSCVLRIDDLHPDLREMTLGVVDLYCESEQVQV